MIKISKITHVIHFTVKSHVDNSFYVSLQYTYDNVQDTHTLLEYVRLYNKVVRFIHVSTDEVYVESMISADDTAIKFEVILEKEVIRDI
jgi:dTDP-D-glucose 4,6-dehydratase